MWRIRQKKMLKYYILRDLKASALTRRKDNHVINLSRGGLSWPLHYVISTLLIIILTCDYGYASCGTNPQILWRLDGRCGRGFPLMRTNIAAQCNPNSERPCCSDYGYCGNSPSHCRCSACIDYRNIKQEPSCYFSYNKKNGVLESPNFPNFYPLKQSCCYDIKRPNHDYCGVGLTVEYLDVGRPEEQGFCQRDWITLPSCAPERGSRICGNETGQYFQYLYQPGAEAIRFEFHAGDLNERRTGFRIKYELLRTCPGPYQTQTPPVTIIPGTADTNCFTRITDPRGTINTPFFPDAYPNELDCVYEFVRTNPNVCGIRMQTVRFAMEEPLITPFGGACTDFFHLPSCGFLCGTVEFKLIVEFQPGATSFKFHFHSNENNTLPTNPGFLINFEQVTRC